MLRFFIPFFALMLVASSGLQARAILVKETFGGNVPPDRYGWGHKITVHGNGVVVKSTRPNSESSWQETEIAELKDVVINEITNLLDTLGTGPLTFPDIDPCTDVPITNYGGRSVDGWYVLFAQNMGCRTGVLDGFEHSNRLLQILDSLDQIASGN